MLLQNGESFSFEKASDSAPPFYERSVNNFAKVLLPKLAVLVRLVLQSEQPFEPVKLYCGDTCSNQTRMTFFYIHLKFMQQGYLG